MPRIQNLQNQLIHGGNEQPHHILMEQAASPYSYLELQSYNIQSNTTTPPQLIYSVTRDGTYSELGAMNYEMAVSRFSLDTSTLPSFIPLIQPNQPDNDLTIYSFTLYNPLTNTNTQTYVNWSPQNISASEPSPPSLNPNGLQDNSSGYYQCQNVQWFYKILQDTLNTCMTDFITAGGAPVGTPSPVLVYDVGSTLASLYFEQTAFETNPNLIYLYCNAPMFALLESFIFLYYGTNGIIAGKNYQFVVNSSNGTTTTTLPTGATISYITVGMTQTSSTVSTWSPINSIVFVSNTIPIKSTYIMPSQIFYEGRNIGNNPSANQTQNIITSFQSENLIYKPFVTYTPSVLRWISLTGNQPLKLFSIQAFWRDNSGNLNPIYLGSNQAFSMLLCFKIKDAY